MRLCDILSEERILVDSDGGFVRDKSDALRLLAHLISPVLSVEQQRVEQLLTEREQLQSTGIGDGVAVPHTSMQDVTAQAAALLLCPHGVPFNSIDGQPVRIVFGVVGPKAATGEHLKTLARISRLLRNGATRSALADAASPGDAYELIRERDEGLK